MIVTDSKGLEQALTQASLRTEFKPERLVENESSRFTATVAYGRALGPEQKIEVAYANDAILRPLDPAQFEVVPRTDMRQNLDEGRPDLMGGLELSWSWDVIPRATGSLTLQLEILPVVIMSGSVVEELARRNRPITIQVLVHPNRPRFEAVVAASHKDLDLNLPQELTAEDEVTLEADLPLHGHGDNVRVDLNLMTADGSVPITVKKRSTGDLSSDDAVHREWIITPGKDGVANMTVVAVITAKAGDETLKERVELKVSRVVEPPWSFGPWLLGVVGGLTAILGLLAAIAAFHKQSRAPLRWLKGKFSGRRGEADPPSSPNVGS
jgi:hypothetical protein